VILAHKLAPAPVLAPFMYTQIIWMILLGYLVFGDVPAPRTLAGTSIIVASGLYLLYRESRNSHGRVTSTLDDA
jgi:drug/metabolite transporter (DMT)-like permease